MNLILNPKETHVLLIGIQEYKKEDYKNVTLANNNLEELKKTFINPNIFGGVPEEQIKTLLNADSHTVLEEIEKLSKSSKDTIIIYYVGHGDRHKGKNLYLTATNTESSLLRTTGIEFKLINDLISDSKAKKRFIILDSCYSGLAALSGDEEPFNEKEIENVRGTYIITSSPSNDKSYYNPKEKFTHFTGELIKILTNGLTNESEFLEMSEIFQAIKTQLSKKGLPLPKKKNTIDTDKIYFANNFIYNEYSNSLRKFDSLLSKGELEEAKKGYTDLISKNKNLPKSKIDKRIYSIQLLSHSDKLFEEDKYKEAYDKIKSAIENIIDLGLEPNENYQVKKKFYEKIIALEENRKDLIVKELEPKLRIDIEEELLSNPKIVNRKVRQDFEKDFKVKLEQEKKRISKQLQIEFEERYNANGGGVKKEEILHISSAPIDVERLRIDLEIRELINILKDSDYELILSMATRPEDLEDLFLDTCPKIIQLSMHAEPHRLVFEDNEGKMKSVNGEKLAQFFSVFTESIECVILNGCHTSEIAYYLSQQINYVIGVEGVIPDLISIAFSKSFYRAYKKNPNIEFAFDFGEKATKVAHSDSNFVTKLYKKGDFDRDVWETMRTDLIPNSSFLLTR